MFLPTQMHKINRFSLYLHKQIGRVACKALKAKKVLLKATPLEDREVNQTVEQIVLESRMTRSLYGVN